MDHRIEYYVALENETDVLGNAIVLDATYDYIDIRTPRIDNHDDKIIYIKLYYEREDEFKTCP